MIDRPPSQPAPELSPGDKALRVLTRCGPYSRMQAQDLILLLTPEESAALVQLHDQLEKPRVSLADLLSRIDDRLHQVRTAEAAKTGQPPAIDPRLGPRQRARLAARSPDGIPDLDPGSVLPSPIPAFAGDESTDLE